jgi:hypothetical protein
MTLFPNFDDYFYMSYDSTQLYSVKVGQTDIYNLEGPINKWVKGQEVFQIESHMMSLANRPNSDTTCTPEDVKDYTSEVKCSSYFIYTIQSSSQRTVKKRSYTTLIDALGSVGGINGILMLFCGILYSNINVRKRNMYLVNNVYPLLFKTKKQIEEQKRQDERELEATDGDKSMMNKIMPDQIGFCKKKSKKQVEREKIEKKRIDMALQRIQSCLDIKTMVESSYKLQVLSSIFLEQRHHGLAQIVDFNMWEDLEKEKERSKRRQERYLEKNNAHFFNMGAKMKEHRIELAHKLSSKYKESVKQNYDVNQGLVSDIDKRLDVFIDSFFIAKLSRPDPFKKKEKVDNQIKEDDEDNYTPSPYLTENNPRGRKVCDTNSGEEKLIGRDSKLVNEGMTRHQYGGHTVNVENIKKGDYENNLDEEVNIRSTKTSPLWQQKKLSKSKITL